MRSIGLLLMVLCLSLSACDTETSPTEPAQADPTKEAHFLFFDADQGSKRLQFRVNETLNHADMDKIRLFQGDTAVSDYIKISKGQYQDHKLDLTLVDYVSAFNTVELNPAADGQVRRLPIGQFYLDRLENIEDSVEAEDAYALIAGHAKTEEGTYTAEATFLKGKAEGLQMRLPDSFAKTGYHKELEAVFEDAQRIEYKYGLRIPKSYYTNNDREAAAVEILWTQVFGDGREAFVFQEQVSLDR